MATFNLIRNSRVFFTTLVDATTGVINTGGTITSSNTFELQVLDGFSFSQGTNQATIQISESGNTPTRGQRSFNTALNAVDFSFSTYVRPINNATVVSAEEKVLWNALMSAAPIDTTGTTFASTTLSRATTLTNVATIVKTSTDMTAAGFAINDWVNVKGATGTNAEAWNSQAQITNLQPSATACTTITLAYAVAPVSTATTAATGATIALWKGAWVAQPAAGSAVTRAQVSSTGSNKNQLQKFGMYFLVDNLLYAVDNCALDQASIDFGLDGIATIAWTGKATALRQLPSTAVVSSANPAVFSGAGNATGTAAAKETNAQYITNKLSSMTLIAGIQGVTSGTTYSIPLTGGNLTYANNINYVIPANLGVVNTAIGYFTGSRNISGNVTAYLRTGTTGSAQLLADILAGTATTSETKFRMQIEVGGATNTVHVDLDIKGAELQVPSISTGDVMSVTINFTAQGFDPVLATNTYDLAQTNDLTVTYYA